MTERTWFDGGFPAIATDALAVIIGGDSPVAAARRVLAVARETPGPADVLDALLADGVAAVPAFAVVALVDERLTAFVRGDFVLRFEDRTRRVWRLDGVGAHTWREVEADGVTRAWAGAPDAEPRLLDLGTTPERPVVPGPTTADGVVLRHTPAIARVVPVIPPRPPLPPVPAATAAGNLDALMTAAPATAPVPTPAVAAVPAPAAAPAPVPAPAAAPAPAPAAPFAPPAPVAAPALAPVPAPRTPRPPHAIVLPDGERIPIRGTLLIGRGPRSERVDGAEIPTLVPLSRAPRDISRSHVRIWSDGTRVQIEDLATPGGTALIDADGVARLLVADRPAEVREGASVELAGGARIRFVGDA
ncbi:FHA domain-containing protein [Microbacterium sp. NPDC089189]|uniref:FHA domain-containing protein n=1 Tax=Microbacterium sp. NPDC089189 TaxID=3154972 RepID=UPI00342BE4DB